VTVPLEPVAIARVRLRRLDRDQVEQLVQALQSGLIGTDGQ
jgi:hypothetical protein